MAFLDTLKSGWDKVKSLWNDLTSPTTTTTATTPTTTTTPTTNTSVVGNVGTVVPNVQSAQTLNSLVQGDDTQQSQGNDRVVSKGSEYYDYSANDEQKVKERLKEREEPEGIISWLTNKIGGLVDLVNDYNKGADAANEYERTKKVTNIGYNKDNNNVYTLELDDGYQASDGNTITNADAFNQALAAYDATIQAYGGDNAPDEIKYQAFQKLYDDTKGLFVAKGDDWYGNLKRRKDMFSEGQLELLAKNNVSEGKYVPTISQFRTYLENAGKNIEIGNEINKKYNVNSSVGFDLNNSQTSNAEGVFMNKAMQGVMDIAKANLNSQDVAEAVANAYVISKNNFERLWDTARPVFDAAAVIRQKIKEGGTISQEERDVLDAANKLDDMMNAEANALNFWVKDHMDKSYVEDGSITSARDIFSDGRTLHQVISQPVLEAAGLEDDPNKSWIDAFQEVTNEALYKYEQSEGSAIGNAWEWFQHKTGKVGSFLSEAGQQTVYGLMQLSNYYGDASTFDYGSLADRWNGRKAGTKMGEYLNQDFTMGTLINTEETGFTSMFGQDFSRTFRKYMAKAAEYGPEMAGNIIPDIILISATGGMGAPATIGSKLPTITNWVSKGARLAKVNQLMEKISGANNIRKAIGGIRGLEEAAASLTKSGEVPQWLRHTGGRVSKLIKDGLIDQAIDGQYNQYDTEAYSDVSFGLSLGGTALGELLPWLYKSGAFKQFKNALVGDYITKGTAWDAIDFLSKPENQKILENLTSKYGKNGALSFDDFRRIGSNMEDLGDLLEKNWNAMPDYLKPSVNKWNKELAWRIMNQVYDVDSNSILGRNIRAIISKEGTSLADLYKFIGNIPGDVKIGPWRSIIKIKNLDGSTKGILGVEGGKATGYSQKLDMILDGGLTSKLENGFSLLDINKIKSLPEYNNITDAMFMLDKDGKYYITKEGVDALGISTVDMPLEYHARELAKAEAGDVSEQFRRFMTDVKSSRKNVSDATINEIANSGTYQDVRDKVADIVC